MKDGLANLGLYKDWGTKSRVDEMIWVGSVKWDLVGSTMYEEQNGCGRAGAGVAVDAKISLESHNARFEETQASMKMQKTLQEDQLIFKAKLGSLLTNQRLNVLIVNKKSGIFARECRFAKYQENRANGRQEKKTVAIEDSNSKALVVTDNNEDIDWTKEFDAEPVTYAMMALTGVEQDDWSMEFDADYVILEDGLSDFGQEQQS
ncbi:hypothetical protein Tco_0624278 [Tanacetum coccineum]|uniref:Uncharacterized protein n=1 Tax=Tanacetum coccineum TaxID=301880 RepID=A0ABQ4WDH2_9ASTR